MRPKEYAGEVVCFPRSVWLKAEGALVVCLSVCLVAKWYLRLLSNYFGLLFSGGTEEKKLLNISSHCTGN